MSRLPRLALLTLATSALLAACGGGSNDAELQLNLRGLENLGANAVYEGWVIVNGSPVTTGRFTVNDAGTLSQTRFPLGGAMADAASTFVLTIEPASGDAPGPTDIRLLAGDFNAGKTEAVVSVGHAMALGAQLATAQGRFMLATPSSADSTDDALGIWWLTMVNGAPQAGLTLPALPSGWIYEGWVVLNGQPVSTGRFRTAAGADSDGAGPTSGPLGGPPFPGQDFINPPRSLPGGAAVISIEPVMDNSPAPFTLKPLAVTIGAGLGPANVQTMTNTVGDGSSLPRGSVSLVR